MSTYRAVPPQVDLTALEHAVLEFWQREDVFARSLDARTDAPLWVFYEGPPTANGRPGTHHIEARVFKDVFPRFKTMKGFRVERKAGWDCHGLPVELAVEKELGFSGKGEIEAYGIAEFNARCRESVERHVDAFQAMTTRMGYWVNLDEAYRTMDPEYVDSVWWSLQQIHAKGLLVEDHRVTPYCPRCGTALSDHELAQGYETVTDPSVYVRFPVTDGPLAAWGAALLVWTTTPWTLVSNTAAAVGPDVDYVAVRLSDDDVLVVADALREKVLGRDDDGALRGEVVWTGRGRELEGTGYQRPFDWITFPDDADPRTHTVLLADFVTTDDGTGLVHEAPAFGADDLTLCRSYGLPVVNPIERDGTFAADVPHVGGMFFKSADGLIVGELDVRGLLFRVADYEHTYPHCWRCHTALIYYAQPSWYVRTTAIKDALLRENARTDWHPETIQWGRYGDWLTNNVDWALSRDRFWGTPLPVWRCAENHLTVVGSRAELGALAGQDLSDLDPHRPFVDAITLPCSECGDTAHRVPQVIDAWYDSGAMPFAQWGFPWHNRETFEARYPAQYICEALDQTRGWFYSLMAIGTLVFDRSSYETVLCLGLILAEDGRKMSKHLGNILEPIPLMETHGADAVRWFMAASGSPWQPRRVGHAAIGEVVRKVLLTYWNTVAFQSLYARTAGWSPADPQAPAPSDRPVLDRWALSEAHRCVREVDAALEAFDTQRAGALLSGFVDDLSNWYVRRSRRRFWAGEPAALATLHECLELVTRLMAPLTPFITERVWQDLVVAPLPDAAASVHLASWPVSDPSLVDDGLRTDMAMVRRLVELGRAARAESKVRGRQPLSRALVAAPGWEVLSTELRAQVAEELNVGTLAGLGEATGELVDVTAKGNFRALGKRFGKATPVVAAAIAAADAPALAGMLRTSGTATVAVEGEDVEIGPDDVILSETPRTGWAVVAEGPDTIALDLEITPALRRAGLAREVIRLVQEARKNAGFQVSDRITLTWSATGETADALEEHRDLVAQEVLATSISRVDTLATSAQVDEPALGLRAVVERGAGQ